MLFLDEVLPIQTTAFDYIMFVEVVMGGGEDP
jgi:hypothetical protein